MYKANKRKHEQSRQIDQLSFRLQIARQLTSKYTATRKRGQSVSFLATKSQVPDDVRLQQVGNHMPQTSKTFLRCRLYSSAQRKKHTCSVCDVPLCVGPCFHEFHGK